MVWGRRVHLGVLVSSVVLAFLVAAGLERAGESDGRSTPTAGSAPGRAPESGNLVESDSSARSLPRWSYTSRVTTKPTDENHLGNGQSVTLAFGGDVHFEGEVRRLLDRDPAAVFGPLTPILSGADLAFVNLETALTDRGTRAPKEYTFRAPANAIEALRSAGIDAVSMANNHGLDFGLEGLEDSLTVAYLTQFPVIGIGLDDPSAYRPYETVIKGQRVAVIAATQVIDDSLIDAWTAGPGKPGLASAKNVDRLLQAVHEVRARTDTLVVFLHWGTERMTCPNPQQEELAQQLADAGADVIVGSHAHRVLAGGRLGRSVVHFGLGNFVFYSSTGRPQSESGVFTVTVTGRRVDDYRWTPARIEGGVPHPLEGEDAALAWWDWIDRRACTMLGP